LGAIAAQTPPRRVRLLGALTGAGLVAAGVLAYMLLTGGGGAPAPAAEQAAGVPPVVDAAGLVRRSGVRVVHVAMTGDGGLVDLRFQVIDPDTANVVHEPAYPPEVVDEDSGVVVNELLMGHRHSGRMLAGQTYYLIFSNPGNLVQRGDHVTVVLGNARLPHVPVE
jgi:hypothetical protein